MIMDTSSLGFAIPTLADIIGFIFFRLLPITTLVLALLYYVTTRFVRSPIKALSIVFAVPLIVIMVFSIFYMIFVVKVENLLQSVNGLMSTILYSSILLVIGMIPIQLLLFIKRKSSFHAIVYVVVVVIL